jgi:hypothetical protein
MLTDRGGTEGIKEGARGAGEKAKETAQTVKEKLPGSASEGDAGAEEDEEPPAA